MKWLTVVLLLSLGALAIWSIQTNTITVNASEVAREFADHNAAADQESGNFRNNYLLTTKNVCDLGDTTPPTNPSDAAENYKSYQLRALLQPTRENVMEYVSALKELERCDSQVATCFMDDDRRISLLPPSWIPVFKNETFGAEVYFCKAHLKENLDVAQRRAGVCESINSNELMFSRTEIVRQATSEKVVFEEDCSGLMASFCSIFPTDHFKHSRREILAACEKDPYSEVCLSPQAPGGGFDSHPITTDYYCGEFPDSCEVRRDVYINHGSGEERFFEYMVDPYRSNIEIEGDCVSRMINRRNIQPLVVVNPRVGRYPERDRLITYNFDTTKFETALCTPEQISFIGEAVAAAGNDWIDACPECGFEIKEENADQALFLVEPANLIGNPAVAFYPQDTYIFDRLDAGFPFDVKRRKEKLLLDRRTFCPSTNKNRIGYYKLSLSDGWRPEISLRGVLRHEFGHILGYGHEYLGAPTLFSTNFECPEKETEKEKHAKLLNILQKNPDRGSVMMRSCGRIELDLPLSRRPSVMEWSLSARDISGHKCFYMSDNPEEECFLD